MSRKSAKSKRRSRPAPGRASKRNPAEGVAADRAIAEGDEGAEGVDDGAEESEETNGAAASTESAAIESDQAAEPEALDEAPAEPSVAEPAGAAAEASDAPGDATQAPARGKGKKGKAKADKPVEKADKPAKGKGKKGKGKRGAADEESPEPAELASEDSAAASPHPPAGQHDGFADDEAPEASDAEAESEEPEPDEPIHQRGVPVSGKASSNADLARAAKRARRRGDTEVDVASDDETARDVEGAAAEPPEDRRITAAELAQALGDPDGEEGAEGASIDGEGAGGEVGEGVEGEEGEDDEGVAASFPTSANQLNETQLMCLVEALIFASDKPLTVVRLRQLTRVSDAKRLQRALDQLVQSYQGRGIAISSISGGYQFRTESSYSSWVQQLIAGRPVRLSRAQLETLAIIAYRQPITRPEIDEIRGVDSSGTLKMLMDRSLVRTLGKREEVGRPVLYGTTKEFLDFFSLGDLRELPTLREYSELSPESRAVVTKLGFDTPGAPTDPATDAPAEAGVDSQVAVDEPLGDLAVDASPADEPVPTAEDDAVAIGHPPPSDELSWSDVQRDAAEAPPTDDEVLAGDDDEAGGILSDVPTTEDLSPVDEGEPDSLLDSVAELEAAAAAEEAEDAAAAVSLDDDSLAEDLPAEPFDEVDGERLEPVGDDGEFDLAAVEDGAGQSDQVDEGLPTDAGAGELDEERSEPSDEEPSGDLADHPEEPFASDDVSSGVPEEAGDWDGDTGAISSPPFDDELPPDVASLDAAAPGDEPLRDPSADAPIDDAAPDPDLGEPAAADRTDDGSRND